MTIAGAETRRLPNARLNDPYKAFWQTDNGVEGLRTTIEQLKDWLREKDIDVDLEEDYVDRTPTHRLICLHHLGDRRHDVQARLVEHTHTGTWTTELTVASTEREGGWLRLAVSSAVGKYVGTPRLAGYLLESGLFRDGGSLGLTPTPTEVHLAQVEDLAAVLTDVNRQGLAFVSGCREETPFDEWAKKVAKWTRDVTGLGEVFVLDPLATSALADILGADYAVQGGTLRTYRPALDPALAVDARRHRYLSQKRLEESSVGGIAKLLGRIAREHNAARPLPQAVTAVFRAFGRIENKVLAKELSAPSTSSAADSVATVPAESNAVAEALPLAAPDQAERLVQQIEEYTRQLELVRRVLGIDVITEKALSALTQRSISEDAFQSLFLEALDAKQDEINRLEDELTDANERLFDVQDDFETEIDKRSEAEDAAKWYRQQLAELKRWDLAHAAIPDEARTTAPATYEDLLERLDAGELQGVVFTGDRSKAEELDGHYDVRASVRAAWDACLALASYIRYRRDGNSCNVYAYLQEAPVEFDKVPMAKFAATESDSVLNNPKWKDERCFPVPTNVDSSGFKHMFAHFKCGRLKSISPRMYFLDDYYGTGQIYIGYIGRHLTNTLTN